MAAIGSVRVAPVMFLAAALCAGAQQASAQTTFNVSFDASAAAVSQAQRNQITSHVQEAGRRWVSFLALTGPRSIDVEIGLDAGVSTANGASVTTGFVGVVMGRDTFEQGVAAELRTGVDPNGVGVDARIVFGTAYLSDELWFDPNPLTRTAMVPIDRTDAMSVILHELGHVIAYNGWANGAGIPPATFWSPFDRWMQPGSPTTFNGPFVVPVWGSAPELTTNNIHHWGNPVRRATAIRAAPPIEWKDGAPSPLMGCNLESIPAPSSEDFDPALRRVGGDLIAELMNGVVYFRGSRYDISALDLAVLKDVGLTLSAPSLFASGFETP